jgi:hypothetical protein
MKTETAYNKDMSRQEAFDVVVDHLRTQKNRSVAEREPGRCVYGTSGGVQCAIGIFLPPDHESREYAGSLLHLLHDFPDLYDYLPTVLTQNDGNRLFGYALQNLHDSPDNWDELGIKESVLVKFAEVNVLELEYKKYA